MKKIIYLIALLLFIGCDNVEITNTTDNNTTSPSTQNPVANAGSDKTVALFDNVEIIGSGTDSDGAIVDYEWKEGTVIVSGLRSFIYDAKVVGEHTLTLTVVDEDENTDNDTMTVTVTDTNVTNDTNTTN